MVTHARALIFDTKGNVLLGLESYTKEYGLAGGRCKEDEHPVDALLREVREEVKLGPNFLHIEYLREYLNNAVFLVIVDAPPTTPNPTQDPDNEFLSFIWADPANLPDSVSEFASDTIFNYLCQLEGKATAAVKWSDFIRGEFWLTDHGTAEPADSENGDGHVEVALRDFFGQYFDSFKEALGRDDIQEPEDLILPYLDNKIPEEIGKKVMGGELWNDLHNDVRGAYTKHCGAVLVMRSNFAAWKITPKVISNIQNFLTDEAGGESSELDSDSVTSICIEEYSTSKHKTLPVSDFLNIKNPGELWRYFAHVEAGIIEILVDGKKIGDFSDDQIWETMPRLAQERAKGRKVSFRQVLDNGEVVDMDVGVGLPGLSEASIDSLESAIDEFREHQSDYVGFIKMTDSVAQELHDELQNIEEAPIYRCISVKNKDEFLKGLQSRGTGIYWTHNPDKAKCYWGDDDDKYHAILTGVAGDAIDWMGTIEQHMRPSTAGEDEVRLLAYKNIQIKEVEIFDHDTKDSAVIPIGKKLPTGGSDREKPPAKMSASLSVEGIILKIVNYYFDNYYHVECPPVLVTTMTTSEPWLAKTEKSDRGIELIVNNAIVEVPKVLRQAVAHESIHVFLYSQDKFKDPHGPEFDKWAEIINSDEGPNYVNKTAEQTSF